VNSKIDKVFKAQVAGEIQRYEDIAIIIKDLISHNVELSTEERNLFIFAYKNLMNNLRIAFHNLSDFQKNKCPNDNTISLVGTYKENIRRDANCICNEAIALIDDKLLPTTNNDDHKTFYLKFKGDLYRYYCEFLTGEQLKITSTKSNDSYITAIKAAEALPAVNPIKLGLLLNYSVYLSDVQSNPKEACKIAQAAYNDAMAGIDQNGGNQHQETIYILQILRDVTLWNDE
jgi:hypothetical protein